MAVFIGGGLRLEFLASVTAAAGLSPDTSITTPASVEEGDFILHVDFIQRALAAPPKVVPTGYTEIVDTAGSSGSTFYRIVVSAKIATDSDASVAVSGMGGTVNETNSRKTIAVFRPNKPPTSFSANPSPANEQATAGDPTEQLLEVSGGAKPAIAFGVYAMVSDLATPSELSPRTFTIDGDDAKDDEILCDVEESGGFRQTWLAYKIMNTNSLLADVTVDTDDSGFATFLQSFWLEFTA